MLKKGCFLGLTFLAIFFQSCFFNNLAPEKKGTQQQYESFLVKNKNKVELIADKCYELQIKYASGDSIFKIIQVDSLRDVIVNIKFIKLNMLPDYVAYEFKLNIKENKCVDFFLVKIFSDKKDKNG
jgi:hypothetical protein